MTTAELQALLAAATPGEWVAVWAAHEWDKPEVQRLPSGAPDDGSDVLATVHGAWADASLMAAAPALAREVVELRREVARLRGWVGHRLRQAAAEYLRSVDLADTEDTGCPGPGREAEELRAGLEALFEEADISEENVRALLDRVNARDALAYLEERDAAEAAAKELRVLLAEAAPYLQTAAMSLGRRGQLADRDDCDTLSARIARALEKP